MQSQYTYRASLGSNWPILSAPRPLAANSAPSFSRTTEHTVMNSNTEATTWSRIVSSRPPTSQKEHSPPGIGRMALKIPRNFNASVSPNASPKKRRVHNNAPVANMWDDRYGPEPLLTVLPKLEKNPFVDGEDQDTREAAVGLMKLATSHVTSAGLPGTVQDHEEKKERDNKTKYPEQKQCIDEWADIRAAVEAAALQGAARIGSSKKNTARTNRLVAFDAGQGNADISPTKQTSTNEIIDKHTTIPFNTPASAHQGWLSPYEGKDSNDANSHHCIDKTNEPDNNSGDCEGGSVTTYYGTDGSYETGYKTVEWDNTSRKLNWAPYPWKHHERLQQVVSANFDQGRQREGSWSSSKSRLSDEEKDRKRWEAIQTNMRRTGLDKSPHVPVNFEEYIDLKCATAEFAADAGRKQLRYREECDKKLRRQISAGQPLEQLAGQLTIPQCLIEPVDELSVVLARRSIWAEELYLHQHTHWPGLKEFKAAGDDRAQMQASRTLPEPRTDELDPKFAYLTEGPDAIPTYGPEVPWEYRTVAQWAVQSPRYDCLIMHEAIEMDDPTWPVAELKLSEVNETIQGLIEKLDNME
ncbi:hypothetical protein HD806DRAFT_527015 [Xylariaceae sp. AK1471]|nr:hypothetical protein HD806DRAFT_527015 [Xylariaceae sp. AK1471]